MKRGQRVRSELWCAPCCAALCSESRSATGSMQSRTRPLSFSQTTEKQLVATARQAPDSLSVMPGLDEMLDATAVALRMEKSWL